MRKSVLVGRLRTIACQLWRILVRADRIKIENVVLRTRDLSRKVRMGIYADEYEKEEAEIVTAAVRPGDSVLELGTGIGFICTKMAKLGAKDIYTFEANPALRERALETFRLNRVTPHFESAILGEREGTTDFYVQDDFVASSTMRQQGATKVEVPVLSFNDFVRARTPNLLVCDIEGGEKELVTFADLSSFDRIVMELHPDLIGNDATVEVVDTLRAKGFKPNYSLSRNGVYLFER